jgi:hypothetical protein
VEVKKENLQKLIELIKEVLKDPKNNWFKEALLADIFGLSDDPEDKSWIAKINMIEQYLSIDGFQVIDYSFIENERVRNQLICDNIEMSRHRLGKRTGKVDFEEYCRFATLQIEELLNYFYSKRFNKNLSDIITFIQSNVPDKFEVRGNSLGAISLWLKFEAFMDLTGLKTTGKLHQIGNFLIKLRNEGSHRNTLADSNEDNALREAEVRGFFGFVDFKRFTPAETNAYNKVQYIIFKRKQDFILVAENLEYLKEAVRLSIPKNSNVSSTETK